MPEYTVSVDAGGWTYLVSTLRKARAVARVLARDYGQTASDIYVQDADGNVVAHYHRSPEGNGRRWYWAELGVR